MGNTIPTLRLRGRSSTKKRRQRNKKEQESSSLSASVTSTMSSSSSPHYVFGTLCLHSYADVAKAVKTSSSNMMPRTIRVSGKFLNGMTDFPSKHHRRSVRRVLRRGCQELKLLGNNPLAPRRVFDGEVSFVVTNLQHAMLEGLVLENLNVLPQQPQDSHTLASQLSKLTNLQTLVLKSTRINGDLLKDVLRVLEKLPRLQHVTLHLLDLSEEDEQVLEEVATQLLSKKSTVLQSIALPHCPASPAFWQALEKSSSLQGLSVTCHDASKDMSMIRQMLSSDKCRLKELELQRLGGPDGSSSKDGDDDDDEVDTTSTWCDALADGLRHNTQLAFLDMTVRDHPSATKLVRSLLPVLEQDNFTLRNVTLHQETPSPREANNISICCPSLHFYTQLNQQQRKHLLRECPTQEEWRKVLAQAKDLSTLYYWLRMQPTLLNSAF